MEQRKTQIEFSPFESEIFKLKVGRIGVDDFDPQLLQTELLNGEYDLCRVKVPCSNEDTILKLEQLGLPYYFSASIRRYKTPVKNIPDGKFLHDDIVYEKYDRSKDQLLYDMLVSCWGDYPMGYYRTPFLSNIISKEQEIQCVFKYYQKYNLQEDYPNNTIMFMKRNGEYVGFFALNVFEDRLESHIGGILKPFQRFGYFYDMQEYIRRFCLNNDLTYFCFGARNENGRVQTIFRRYGYEAYGTDNVFHIPCLLSLKGESPTIYKELVIESNNQIENRTRILNLLINEKKSDFPKTYSNFQSNYLPVKQITEGKYKVEIDHPLSTSLKDVFRVKVYQNKILHSVGTVFFDK